MVYYDLGYFHYARLLFCQNYAAKSLLKYQVLHKVFNLFGLTCDERRALGVEWGVSEGHGDRSLPSPLPPHQGPEELYSGVIPQLM